MVAVAPKVQIENQTKSAAVRDEVGAETAQGLRTERDGWFRLKYLARE